MRGSASGNEPEFRKERDHAKEKSRGTATVDTEVDTANANLRLTYWRYRIGSDLPILPRTLSEID